MRILKSVLNEPEPDLVGDKKKMEDIVFDCSQESQKVAAKFYDVTKLLAELQQAFAQDSQKKKIFDDNNIETYCMIQSQTNPNLQVSGDQAHFVNEQRRSRSAKDVDVFIELLRELFSLQYFEGEGTNLTQLQQVTNKVLEILIFEWKKMVQSFHDLTNFLEKSLKLKIEEFLGYVDETYEEGQKGHCPFELLKKSILSSVFGAAEMSCQVHFLSKSYCGIYKECLMPMMSQMEISISNDPIKDKKIIVEQNMVVWKQALEVELLIKELCDQNLEEMLVRKNALKQKFEEIIKKPIGKQYSLKYKNCFNRLFC